jgi:hypothetical protein
MGELTSGLFANRYARAGAKAAAVGMLAVLTACASSKSGGVEATPSGSGTSTVSPNPSRSHAPFITIIETADNHLGSTVVADPSGKAVPNNVPGRLPYGTAVGVDCYADNASGMPSVNSWYHIVNSPNNQWNGMYVAANTMDNGGPMGPNDVNFDPRLQNQHC